MTKEPERRNQPALSLHVPEPQGRPGEEPDFSNLEIPPAGSVPRPDTSAPPEVAKDLVYTLVRPEKF